MRVEALVAEPLKDWEASAVAGVAERATYFARLMSMVAAPAACAPRFVCPTDPTDPTLELKDGVPFTTDQTIEASPMAVGGRFSGAPVVLRNAIWVGRPPAPMVFRCSHDGFWQIGVTRG